MNFYFKLLLACACLLIQSSGFGGQGGGENQFRMGFYAPSLAYVSRTDMQVSLEYWAQEIASHQKIIKGAPVTIFSDIKEMAHALEQGELDMVLAPPIEMARYFKRELLSDGFKAVRDDIRTNAIVILARNDKGIRAIGDIKRKRLLLDQSDALAEIVLETFLQKNLKQRMHKVFSDITPVVHGNRIVLDLFFDKADVAVAYESAYQKMTELNPQVGSKLQVLYRHPVTARNFSFFRKGYPHSKEMIAIATNLKTPRLQQILQVFQTSAIQPCSVDELKDYDELYQGYLRLNN